MPFFRYRAGPCASACGLALVAALFCSSGRLKAEDAPGPAAPELITTVGQFWNISGPAKQQLHHVRVELVVCYYDPGWKLLWGESSGGITFVQCGLKHYPMHEGQRILIDGLMVPAEGLNLDRATVHVLASGVPLHPEVWRFAGTAAEAARLPARMVIVGGFVDRQSMIDPDHLLLDMTVGKWPMQARVLLPPSSPEPQFEGAFVRVRGVLVPNATPAGRLSTLALWIARPADIRVTGWLATDPRFNQKRVPIARLPSITGDRTVRVVGRVWDQEPGHSLTIRDDTGQVTIVTGQFRSVSRGTQVEAVGRPDIEGTRWRLRDGLFRVLAPAQAQAAKRAGGPPPILRLADQVLDLGNDRAAGGLPVELYGVATWTDPAGKFFYLADASGGIRVETTGRQGSEPMQGDAVNVTGTSASGSFAPMVKADRLTVAGSLSMPVPQEVTLDQALTGVEEGRWVEMEGYLREVGRMGALARLDLTTAAGSFTAWLPFSDHLNKLVGSIVRLQGVCTAIANEKHELTGIRLLVPSASPDYVRVEQAAPANPFAVPERTIASLRQFSPLQTMNHRVRIRGSVLLQNPGRYLYVQDATDSVLVLSRDTSPLSPGDRIEVVGFPGREGGRLVMREAIFRRLGSGVGPAPVVLDTSRPVQDGLDGHLIRVTGVLLDTISRNGTTHYMIQGAKAVFEARLDRSIGTGETQLSPGSRISLTGVYEVQYDEYRHPQSFEVQLRKPADVRVLSRPPWWTIGRALSGMGLLALCTVLIGAWVLTLQRRVRKQTAQIRTQLEREARLELELERSAKLESLGVLAGGIAHDFNNLLTVIMGNVTLAKLDAGGHATLAGWLGEAERGVIRARDLTLQLLTFAKGGDPVRSAVALPDIVREAAEFALHGSKARCEFDVEPGLWPADVDKGQIGQVVQNIVINASQAMSVGGVIRIALRNAVRRDGSDPASQGGRMIELAISDTGVGIPKEHLARLFDPYFTTKHSGSGLGLATAYSIVKRHQGHIDVESQVGRGTTFRIWLPAAGESGPQEPPPAPTSGSLRGRVLLMDDEDAIRQAAGMILQRLGLDVVTVADGRHAVDAYVAARRDGQAFDLVIVDLTVPGGMGGREAIEALRRIDPGVRALVSSGYSSDPVLAHHRDYGFVGTVRKPYELSELAAAVGAALAAKR